MPTYLYMYEILKKQTLVSKQINNCIIIPDMDKTEYLAVLTHIHEWNPNLDGNFE